MTLIHLLSFSGPNKLCNNYVVYYLNNFHIIIAKLRRDFYMRGTLIILYYVLNCNDINNMSKSIMLNFTFFYFFKYKHVMYRRLIASKGSKDINAKSSIHAVALESGIVGRKFARDNSTTENGGS